jgi:hypothetical protein
VTAAKSDEIPDEVRDQVSRFLVARAGLDEATAACHVQAIAWCVEGGTFEAAWSILRRLLADEADVERAATALAEMTGDDSGMTAEVGEPVIVNPPDDLNVASQTVRAIVDAVYPVGPAHPDRRIRVRLALPLAVEEKVPSRMWVEPKHIHAEPEPDYDE